MPNWQTSMDILFEGEKKKKKRDLQDICPAIFFFFPSLPIITFIEVQSKPNLKECISLFGQHRLKEKDFSSLQTHQIQLFLLKGRAQEVARARCRTSTQQHTRLSIQPWLPSISQWLPAAFLMLLLMDPSRAWVLLFLNQSILKGKYTNAT